MKIIEYKGKAIKLPFAVGLSDDPTAEEEIRNRFGGESCMLPGFAVAVYDVILGSEVIADQNYGPMGQDAVKTMRKGLDWFRKYFPKQYMTLLDQQLKDQAALPPALPFFTFLVGPARKHAPGRKLLGQIFKQQATS